MHGDQRLELALLAPLLGMCEVVPIGLLVSSPCHLARRSPMQRNPGSRRFLYAF